ncbi:PadR family transcriptional regulator [Thermococcus peptonophilus]|uniref:Transcriptional regulator n=1 Tax=Thermococcus peptonophilus TaxID=53952 RepID=A0A142CUN8_9EURY|nr:PadR family transcriptional regulator [Thermococcus peptonophilus]AMQ18490.1 transcriptional regulator [Thermococcus peptonophilus]
MLGKREEKALKKLRKELRSGLYSFLVLSILEREGELHGYAIRKRLEELSGGKLVPSEGALYDILKGLKKLGLLQDSWAEAGGRPRKYYSITEMGKIVLAQLREEIRVIESVLEKLEGSE